MEADPKAVREAFLVKQCAEKPQMLSFNDIYQFSNSDCSYCHSKNTNFTWSFSKQKVEPFTYQLLMERGWRRCGTYYYKPDLSKCCCKMFTHRLDVTRFRPKKDQKKALKRVIGLAYECVMEDESETKKKEKEKEKEKKRERQKSQDAKSKGKYKITTQVDQKYKAMMVKMVEIINQHLTTELHSLISPQFLPAASLQKFVFPQVNSLKFFASKPPHTSDYYCNYAMLLFGLNKKLFQGKYTLIDLVKDLKKKVEEVGSCEQFTVDVQKGGYVAIQLNQKLKKEKTMEFEIIHFQEGAEQTINEKMIQEKPAQVKKEEPKGFMGLLSNLKQKLTTQQPLPNLSVQTKKSSNFQELKASFKGELTITPTLMKFGKLQIHIIKAEQNEESFKLYQRYGAKIHEQKQKNMSSYINFLCLRSITEKDEINQDKGTRNEYIPAFDHKQKYQKAKKVTGSMKKMQGCHHMKYYLDNVLIAVGVVDIVPDGLSSVYFFYEPKFKQYRLGVFSSLMQIEYIRFLQISFPEFKNYYMGFYISNCKKMNYKIDYSPCQLLCPVTYNFVEYNDKLKEKIGKIIDGTEKSVRLSQSDEQLNPDMNFGKDAGVYIDKHIKLEFKGKKLKLKEINPNFFVFVLTTMREYLNVWGRNLFDIFTITF